MYDTEKKMFCIFFYSLQKNVKLFFVQKYTHCETVFTFDGIHQTARVFVVDVFDVY